MIIEEILMEVAEMLMMMIMIIMIEGLLEVAEMLMMMIMIIMIEGLLEVAEISIIIALMINEGIFVGLYLMMITLINKKIGFC